MPAWILIVVLLLIVVGTIVLFVAMFTEMGTKRRSGTMKSSNTEHKSRKK
jgi:uncharacterized membrane protein